MNTKALVCVLLLVGVSALFNDVRGSSIENTYQKVETYYSLVNPKVDLKCNAPIPYLKGSTIVSNPDGTFTVVVSFICGREA